MSEDPSEPAAPALLPADAALLNFLEHSPDGMVIHRDGIIEYVNPVIVRWMGFSSPQDVLGKPVIQWVHPDDRPAVIARIRAAQNEGNAASAREERFLRNDGQVRTFEVSSLPVFFGGGQCVCVFIRDNTTRARAEAERADALIKAERALRARDDLLSIVSHDLRNPLAAIRSSADLIVRIDAESTPSLRATHTILRAATRMDRLISDLLDAGRIEAGLMRVTPNEERFSEVLEDAFETLRPLAEARHVDLTLTACVSSLSLNVRCEHGRLVQVLSNLVGNALQVAPSGSKVAVVVSQEGPMIKVTVTDEGPGIDPAEVGQLFERFYRSRLSSYPGSGLGLFIAKGIVDAHGGTIGVENGPERGCVFWFKVPAWPSDKNQ